MKNFITLLLLIPFLAFAQTREKELTDSAGYQKTALYAWDSKDYKSCINASTILIKLNPKNLKAYTLRASAEWAVKDYNDAINDFMAATKLDERYAWTYYNTIGIIKLDENDLEGAIKYYDKVLSIYPNEGTYSNRGMVWTRMGKYKRAIRDYTQAINIQNADTIRHYAYGAKSYPYTARAKAEALNGDFKQALADFDIALKLKPGDTTEYNGRGEAKNHLGDNTGACADWQVALKLGSKTARENIKKYCGK